VCVDNEQASATKKQTLVFSWLSFLQLVTPRFCGISSSSGQSEVEAGPESYEKTTFRHSRSDFSFHTQDFQIYRSFPASIIESPYLHSFATSGLCRLRREPADCVGRPAVEMSGRG